MGMAGLWEGVNLATRLLATVATVMGCLVIIQGVYEGRHRLRETELLARVRAGKLSEKIGIRLSAQWKIMLTSALVVGLTLLLAYALIGSDVLWSLSKWLLLEPEEPPPSKEEVEKDFKRRVKNTLPLICMSVYVGFSLLITYSSSMTLAQRYAKRMNQVLPHPIFLQDEKLAQIVRKEAEVELGRLDPERLRQKYPDSANISLMGYMQFEEQADLQLLRLTPSVDMSTAVEGPLSPQVALWGQAAPGTRYTNYLDRPISQTIAPILECATSCAQTPGGVSLRSNEMGPTGSRHSSKDEIPL
jgi:hypothetical protein